MKQHCEAPVARFERRLARRLGAMCALLLASTTGCSKASSNAISIPAPSDDNLYEHSVAAARWAQDLAPEGRARPIVNLAKVHQRFGRDDSAEPLLLEVLALDPHDDVAFPRAAGVASDAITLLRHAHADLAHFYSLTSRGALAVRHYQHALRLRAPESNERLWTRLALVLIHLNLQEDAVEALETEIRQGTDDATTYAHLGLARKSLGDWNGAALAFRRAVELAPQSREAIHGLAEALRMTGRAGEAQPFFERFRAIKDEDDRRELEARARASNIEAERRHAALSWYEAAGVLIEEHNLLVTRPGEPDDAPQRSASTYRRRCLDALARAIAFDPALQSAHDLRLDVLRKSGMTEDWLAACRAAAAGVPAADFGLGLAQDLLDRAREVATRDVPLAERHIVAARQVLEDALRHDPTHGPTCGLLAEVYVTRFGGERGIGPRALALATTAFERARTPSAAAYDVLAGAHMLAGSPADALRTLEAGVSKVPAAERPQLERRLAQLRAHLEPEEGRP